MAFRSWAGTGCFPKRTWSDISAKECRRRSVADLRRSCERSLRNRWASELDVVKLVNDEALTLYKCHCWLSRRSDAIACEVFAARHIAKAVGVQISTLSLAWMPRAVFFSSRPSIGQCTLMAPWASKTTWHSPCLADFAIINIADRTYEILARIIA